MWSAECAAAVLAHARELRASLQPHPLASPPSEDPDAGASSGSSAAPYVDDTFPEPAAAIRLASDFGLRAVLPAAFYQLAVTDPGADWDEFRAAGRIHRAHIAEHFEKALAPGDADHLLRISRSIAARLP